MPAQHASSVWRSHLSPSSWQSRHPAFLRLCVRETPEASAATRHPASHYTLQPTRCSVTRTAATRIDRCNVPTTTWAEHSTAAFLFSHCTKQSGIPYNAASAYNPVQPVQQVPSRSRSVLCCVTVFLPQFNKLQYEQLCGEGSNDVQTRTMTEWHLYIQCTTLCI